MTAPPTQSAAIPSCEYFTNNDPAIRHQARKLQQGFRAENLKSAHHPEIVPG